MNKQYFCYNSLFFVIFEKIFFETCLTCYLKIFLGKDNNSSIYFINIDLLFLIFRFGVFGMSFLKRLANCYWEYFILLTNKQ